MDAAQDVIVYRAHRLGSALWTLLFVALTSLCVAVVYAGIVLGEKDARNAWLGVPVAALLGFLAYRFAINVIWPPQLEISRDGLRWAHFDTPDASYGWEAIDGPQLQKIGRSALFVRFVVKATGRELDLALNDIGGATYDEIAAVISSARVGKIISPEKWRIQNPGHSLRDWLLNYGLPVAGALFIAILMQRFTR